MTKKDALTLALTSLPTNNPEAATAAEIIRKMVVQLSTGLSDEKKAEISAARRAATATARTDLVTPIIPILRDVITRDMTAAEIYEAAKDRLPVDSDMTPRRIGNILQREMAAELIKTEARGKANTYRLIQ